MNKIITFVPPRPEAVALPAAFTGQPYQTELEGMIVGGSVPPGLTFDPSTKQLSGTPTEPGSYGLVVNLNPGHKFLSLEVQ